jgi:hypothetical protein
VIDPGIRLSKSSQSRDIANDEQRLPFIVGIMSASMMQLWVLVGITIFNSLVEATHYSEPFIDLYRQYLEEFGKTASRAEDLERLALFAKNEAYITAHNALCNYESNTAEKSCFQLKHSSFSDWKQEELDSFFIDSASLNDTNDDSEQLISSEEWMRVHWSGLNRNSSSVPTHINWASNDNPFGHTILSPVRDQGSCGACWAFVSVATVEASIRLTEEMDLIKAFNNTDVDERNSNSSSSSINNDLNNQHRRFHKFRHRQLEEDSRDQDEYADQQQQLQLEREHRSIKFVYLSPQQLIDCDVGDGNKGCGGGRPSNAFSYIRSFGITRYFGRNTCPSCLCQLKLFCTYSWERYPFFGEEGTCAVASTSSIGFIKGWTALPSSNEYNLMVLDSLYSFLIL